MSFRVIQLLIFTALHGMQTRYSDENSVCLFVRLSVLVGSTGSRWSEIVHFEPIFARSASAVLIPSEKVQFTLPGSPPRAFQ